MSTLLLLCWAKHGEVTLMTRARISAGGSHTAARCRKRLRSQLFMANRTVSNPTICFLAGGEFEDRDSVITLAGLQFCRRKIRVVGRVREVLSLQTQCSMQIVWSPALSFDGSIQ